MLSPPVNIVKLSFYYVNIFLKIIQKILTQENFLKWKTRFTIT